MNRSDWVVIGFSDKLPAVPAEKVTNVEFDGYLLTFFSMSSGPTTEVLPGPFPFLFVTIGRVFFAFGMA